MFKYRWEKTGLHGEVTETANDWNDIGRQAFHAVFFVTVVLLQCLVTVG